MLRHFQLFRAAGVFLPFLALTVFLSACVNPGDVSTPHEGGDYLFCFWNMENFFDDRADGRKTTPDKEYDEWFATDKSALQEKLDHLSSALMKMNGGKGPDIIAGAELESERSAELLMEALNAKVKDPQLQYKHILFREVHGGRHIATAIITRLDVEKNRTQLLGEHQQRILEGHVKVDGHDLVIVASHWTSMVSDAKGSQRDKYAKVIYGRYRAMYESNPKVDFLVCGDFNDSPHDETVTEHLHAIGDLAKVKSSLGEPLLFHLFGDKKYSDGTTGSEYYDGKWNTFDQIAVSPGMLDDEGWTCESDTARIVNDLTQHKEGKRRGQPFRFGNEHDKGERGWSDHFPVTVRLKVASK